MEVELQTVPPQSKLAAFFSILRSLFFFVPLVYLYTAVLGALSLISSLWDRSGRVQHGFARLWSRLILKTLFSPATTVGLENVLNDGKPRLWVFNHASALDIPVLYADLPFQFRIIAKKELFRYPFMGWHLKRSGQIAIDPEDAHSSLSSLNRAAQTLRSGMPLVVFPEGGRCIDGHIQPFLGGGFYAAIRARVDVVPVALVGTWEVLPMNSYHVRPGPVQMIVGRPISTDGMHVRQMDELAARAQRAVEDLYYSRAAVARPEPRPAEAIQSS
ncbi:MAG TPA: lysophospholipid acyltransferase family protein [Terriglobales bacterium]|nr:lysophospholipid acyltransferase family protein [Terriglobales bacterium]